MPDADISFELSEVIFGECLGNQPHIGTYFYSIAIGDSNAGTFLTAMLEGKKSEEDEAGYIHRIGVDAENATTLMH